MRRKKIFYDLEALDITGKQRTMSEFKEKTIIIVNVASFCGFTFHYEGLEKLFQKYKERGLVILAFPCNQFGEQEPKNENEIAEFCKLNYGISFPIFSKIEVNGKKAHPIYCFLKKRRWGILGRRINWNFTKFLVDKNGKVVKRFPHNTKPENMEKEILKILNQ